MLGPCQNFHSPALQTHTHSHSKSSFSFLLIIFLWPFSFHCTFQRGRTLRECWVPNKIYSFIHFHSLSHSDFAEFFISSLRLFNIGSKFDCLSSVVRILSALMSFSFHQKVALSMCHAKQSELNKSCKRNCYDCFVALFFACFGPLKEREIQQEPGGEALTGTRLQFITEKLTMPLLRL